MNRLRRLACVSAIALAASAGFAQPQPAPTPEEWSLIRRLITEQREALIAGDAERAFGYAAPGIRAQYGNADAFMRMVQRGYQSLLTARYVEFLEGAVIEGEVIQPLRLVSTDGKVEVAIYSLARDGQDRWRIAGCLIAPSTVRSA